MTENIICIKDKTDISNRYEAFRNELLTNTDIINVCRSEPMDINTLSTTGDLVWPGKNENSDFSARLLHCDCDYAATYKLEITDGRFYSRQLPTDATNAFVLNKTAVEAMGLTSPIGQNIRLWDRSGQIIGICKDFHYSSLHHKIEPLVIRIPDTGEKNLYYRELSIRIKPNTIHQSLVFIKNKWKTFFPDAQFDYYFFDDYLNNNYHAEQRMGEIFKYFSLMAILIASLGLYGLTAFTIEQKTKDIGIYKVFGASSTNIALLFSKNYFYWIIIANIIAGPVSWFAMNKWLHNFAYRIDITIWPYLLAGITTLIISMISVSLQVMRAAMANPVDAFKYE